MLDSNKRKFPVDTTQSFVLQFYLKLKSLIGYDGTKRDGASSESRCVV